MSQRSFSCAGARLDSALPLWCCCGLGLYSVYRPCSVNFWLSSYMFCPTLQHLLFGSRWCLSSAIINPGSSGICMTSWLYPTHMAVLLFWRSFEERLEPLRDSIPEAIKRVIDDEMGKLSGLEQASSEFNVTRNYLDWLTQLPWGKHSTERLDIVHAQQVCIAHGNPWHCLAVCWNF